MRIIIYWGYSGVPLFWEATKHVGPLEDVAAIIEKVGCESGSYIILPGEFDNRMRPDQMSACRGGATSCLRSPGWPS